MNTQKWTRFFYQPGIGLGENGSRLTQSSERLRSTGVCPRLIRAANRW